MTQHSDLPEQVATHTLSDILKATDASTSSLPPAISLPLTGQHLIEASAGTGKTWTLTGVLLRLLIEAGHPCDKIIATTFTRSAAAEMRQRIRERLSALYQLLQIAKQENLAWVIQDASDVPEAVSHFITWITEQARRRGLLEAVKDPINQHLLTWIAEQVFASQPRFQTPNQDKTNNRTSGSSDSASQAKNTPTKAVVDFRIAIQRTHTALNQLDRLFVSTLDSLCQKWLREFSSETGFSADVQISNDVETVVMGMIHDQLRAFWAHLNHHAPEIYTLMQANGKLLKPQDFYKAVEKTLNFYTAPIDYASIEPFNLEDIRAILRRIAAFDDTQFSRYYDIDYRKAQGFNGRTSFYKKFSDFPQLLAFLRSADIDELLAMPTDYADIVEGIVNFYDHNEGFNKDRDNEKAAFRAFTIVADIAKLAHAIDQLTAHFDDINRYFTQFISRYVHDNLLQVLEAQRLTTFSLQLARLNQALQGQQGEALARYIRHQYPVALIDESQDINTEQALLIQRIYLEKPKTPTDKAGENDKNQDSQFLLLVGDPKQAIYGFRGGDVSNYTTLKQLFHTQPRALSQNRRSSKALIEALNHWYGVNKPTPEQQIAAANANNEALDTPAQPFYLGESIYYQPIDATRDTPALVSADGTAGALPAFYHVQVPVSDAEEADSLDSYDAVTAEILSLMDTQIKTGSQPLRLDGRALRLDDICVLATKTKHLDAVERKLNRAGIATIRGGNQSVFGDTMSNDLLALMTLLLSPHNKAKLKTLLLSSFFQLTLSQANALIETDNASVSSITDNGNSNQTLTNIQNLLIETSEKWQQENFLVAIQSLLNHTIALPGQPALSFWQRLARHPDGERLLIDLRQIIDLISEQFSGQVVGEYQLLDWLSAMIALAPKEEWAIQQRLPSETGVQLMTVHRSKGLEFAIVFVLGMGDGIRAYPQAAPLYLYTQPYEGGDNDNPLLTRRLTTLAQKDDHDYKAGEQQRLFEEKLRLLYVALTRARERVYLVTQTLKKSSGTTALKAFVVDEKAFDIKPVFKDAITPVDINSLSRYKNTHYNPTKKDNEQTNNPNSSADNDTYQKNIAAIKNKSFKGWGNTSFTALSRFMQHNRYDTAVHEPDYDGFDDSTFDDSIDEPDAPSMGIMDDTKRATALAVDSHSLMTHHSPYPVHDSLGMANHFPELPTTMSMSPDDRLEDTALVEADGAVTLADLQSLQDSYTPDYYPEDDLALISDTLDTLDTFDDAFIPPTYEDFSLPDTPLMIAPQPTMPDDESQLIRFTFERGTAAGTFLHKVLEDLANSFFDDTQGSFTATGLWLPPARWSVIIDRALRQQQLPAPYFSTQASSEGVFQSQAVRDTGSLQPGYIALSRWLHDVIHTPLAATGQRPADIKQQQKAAEMGFNMRLNRQLSLSDLNALFSHYHIPLQLQEDFTPSAMWQYLRGETDLVYQHADRFYVVDYKSNYLGGQFADYHLSALQQAMTEHSYWLQASIYQVALHRFLQLRIPDYSPHRHLGAVEYAFIRGMSPQPMYAEYGRLVWQPEVDFVLELDAMFGR